MEIDPEKLIELDTVLSSDDVDGLVEWMGAGFDVNERIDGENPIAYHAAYHNAIACLTLLVERGTSLGFRNSAGDTLLLPAVDTGAADCVKYLLERGVDPNTRCFEGGSVLFTLIGSMDCPNKGEIFDLLDQHGIDVNQKNDAGVTPLIYVAQEMSLSMMKRLVDRVGDINAPDAGGRTALDHAQFNTAVDNDKAANRSRQNVELLKQKGGKPGRGFKPGEYPSDWIIFGEKGQ
jgi:ankyrin repeat protein